MAIHKGNTDRMAKFLGRFSWVLVAFVFAIITVQPMHADARATEKSAKSKQSQSVKSSTVSKKKVTASKSKKKYSTVSSRNKKLKQAASRNKTRAARYMAGAALTPDPSKHASLVIDADSGKVIYASNANEIRHPASLTKMMTLYLTFEAIEKGRLLWDQDMKVSLNASQQSPTNLFLDAGDTISVKEAVYGLIIRSANDAAVVLAEAIGGSEDRFARMMTQKARALGMKNTTFLNASGLPDVRQVTTARDMAALALALKKHFPENYGMFKAKAFSFNGRTYETHNRVLARLEGADGLKTGYTRMSGFNLVTSANRQGHRLIGVVLGGPSAKSRDDQMVTLMDQSFRKVASLKQDDAPVQLAKADDVETDEASEGQGDASDDVATERKQPKSTNAVASSQSVENTSRASGGWGIQVGAFEQPQDALTAISKARAIAPQTLFSSKALITGTVNESDKLHRARMENLSQDAAQSACKVLIQEQKSCFVYRADQASNSL
jgi:D-alanyl-D-alanine carboxypeptidase